MTGTFVCCFLIVFAFVYFLLSMLHRGLLRRFGYSEYASAPFYLMGRAPQPPKE